MEIFCGKLGNRKVANRDVPFSIDNSWIIDDKLKILCAHFSPFKNELEATDYPLFLTKIFPNSTVHATYDKGSVYVPFELSGSELNLLDDIDDQYDIIIGRSSVFNSMYSRHNHKKVLDKSGFKINIKPMGFGSNINHCDFWFDDKYLFCPPSPLFRQRVNSLLNDKNFQKRNMILFSGGLSRIKNQLGFLKLIDPSLCENLNFIFAGNDKSDPEYVQTIRDVCNNKGIKYEILGQVDFMEDMPYYTTYSKLHVVNSDPRIVGQPHDPIPRVLGECALSDTHTICSKTTLFNDDVSKYVTSYDHESSNSLNDAFSKSLDIDSSGYHYELITMEEKCYDMTSLILNQLGI